MNSADMPVLLAVRSPWQTLSTALFIAPPVRISSGYLQ